MHTRGCCAISSERGCVESGENRWDDHGDAAGWGGHTVRAAYTYNRILYVTSVLLLLFGRSADGALRRKAYDYRVITSWSPLLRQPRVPPLRPPVRRHEPLPATGYSGAATIVIRHESTVKKIIYIFIYLYSENFYSIYDGIIISVPLRSNLYLSRSKKYR